MDETEGITPLEDSEEILALGGNIELSGFQKLDRDSMIVLKKIVGNYAKKFSETCRGFQRLTLKMKPVHESEKSRRFELHAMVADNGKNFVSEFVDNNLFFAVDKVFKKIEAEMERQTNY
jgi:hypothetical protein